MEEFRRAVAAARPGDEILLHPGDYAGGHAFKGIHGNSARRIVIRGSDPNNPPRFTGGGSALQFSDVSYVELRDIVIEKPKHNGLNIDDAGTAEIPSHHIKLVGIVVRDTPKGNYDGIKLSGVSDFTVENCTIANWGGSAIDMVGCHRGIIRDCRFLGGGKSAVQGKGGTSEIEIQNCWFQDFGQRGVNLGGSTGLEYFRPPIKKMQPGQRYEAKNMRVANCTFVGGTAPIAFVGAVDCVVERCTLYRPGRWAVRILQETATPDFQACRGGKFVRNIVVFQSANWASGEVNVGPGTDPMSFKFLENFWYCEDSPDRSRPKLPTQEISGEYGTPPEFEDDAKLLLIPKRGSHAAPYGAHSKDR